MVQNRDSAKQAFAKRLHECLDDLGVKRRGRLTRVHEMFGVSISAARKWLEGDSFPDTFRMRDMGEKLHVNGEWLFTGQGLKRILTPVQQRIVAAMNAMHLHPDDVAELSGGSVKAADIDRWISGIEDPTESQVQIVAPYLGHDAEWFLSGAMTIRNPMGKDLDVIDARGASMHARDLAEAILEASAAGELEDADIAAIGADLKRQRRRHMVEHDAMQATIAMMAERALAMIEADEGTHFPPEERESQLEILRGRIRATWDQQKPNGGGKREGRTASSAR